MHLVTRFKGVNPNAVTRHRGRLCVMRGFNDHSLKEAGDLQIIWRELKVLADHMGGLNATGELR